MQNEIMPIFRVLRLIRDARSTRNAERNLLNALAMRCQPAKQFLSWPSYRQLAMDTLLDEVTLKRAAKRLEDAKLIRRVVRANRSNFFFLNIKLLQEQAAAVKAAEDAAKKPEFDEESPFADPISVDQTEIEDDSDIVDPWRAGGAR